MGFRASNGTSHKIKKKKGRWDKSKFKTRSTYSCPKCFNRDPQPPTKRDGTLYCSRCLLHLSQFVTMEKIKYNIPKSISELNKEKREKRKKSNDIRRK